MLLGHVFWVLCVFLFVKVSFRVLGMVVRGSIERGTFSSLWTERLFLLLFFEGGSAGVFDYALSHCCWVVGWGMRQVYGWN